MAWDFESLTGASVADSRPTSTRYSLGCICVITAIVSTTTLLVLRGLYCMTKKQAIDLKNMMFTISKDNEQAILHLSYDELTYVIRCMTEGAKVAGRYGWFEGDDNES